MKHIKFVRVPFVLLALVLVLTACGVIAPVPTATPIPPTATPTDTPTLTPTATPLPDPKTAITDGLARTFQARSLRLDMNMTITSAFGDITLMMQAERNGFNSHLKSVSSFGNVAQTEETLTVDGQRYVHGPNATYGVFDDKWYRLPAGVNPNSATNPTTDPFQALVSNLDGAIRLRSDTLDGLDCDLYSRDKKATLNAFAAFSGTGRGFTDEDLAKVDVAESKYWICNDGYFHQMQINIISQNQIDPTKKDLVTLTLHFSDMGKDIAIDAPGDAVTLPTPTPFVTRTPAPLRTPTPQLTATPNPQANANAQAARANALKWHVVFSDTFSSNANAWPLDDTTTEFGPATATVADGKYRWTPGTMKKDVLFWEVPPKFISSADAYISLSARRVSGPADLDYGFVFRENQSHDSLYVFRIRDDGTFRVSVSLKGSLTTLITLTKSAAIRPGESNRLAVIANGTHMTFFINDQYVADVDDNSVASGDVGVAFGLKQDESGVFEFDDLQVRAP